MLYSAILYALPRLSDESMALYHNWVVKNDFAYVLTFFSLISDSLGSMCTLTYVNQPHNSREQFFLCLFL